METAAAETSSETSYGYYALLEERGWWIGSVVASIVL
jgi:hypothetical protein